MAISTEQDHAATSCSRRGRQASVIVLATLACLAGCQRPPHELAPTEGTVKIAGQPLPAGKVMFAPIAKADRLNAGKPALGIIEPDGRFKLSTYKDGDGAVVGEHWVTIYSPDDSTTATALKTADGRKIERVSVPRKVEVVAGQLNQIQIELTPQELAKYARLGD